MSKCTFIPTNKEGNIPSLFTQLKSYFGNTKQALYYWQRIKSPEFSKTFPNVRYDNEGNPLMEDLMYKVGLDGLKDELSQLKNLNQHNSPVARNYTNVMNLEEQAVSFNRNSPYRSKFFATIDTVEDKVKLSIKPIRENKEDIVHKIEFNSKLNRRLEQLLSDWGIGVGALSELEEKQGINGITDFDCALTTANGLKTLIRVAKGQRGQDVLPEEFAHFAIEAVDTPLKNRMTNVLSDENILERIFGDEYQNYMNKYNNNLDLMAVEALGKIMADVLNDKEVFNPNKRLFDRYLNQVKDKFKDKNTDDIDNIINEVKVQVYNLANDIVNNRYTMNISTKAHNTKLYNLTSNVNKSAKILEKILEQELKRLKVYGDKKDFGAAQQVFINKLQADLQNHQEIQGILEYMNNSLSVLGNLEKKMAKIGSGELSKTEEFKALRNVRNYLNSYGVIMNDIRKQMNEASREGDDSIKENIKDILNQNDIIIKDLASDFYEIAKDKFTEFIRPFVGDGLAITIGRDRYKKTYTAEELVTSMDRDITLADRWLDSMADSSDPMLQIYDQVVKKQKGEARLDTIEMAKEIQAKAKELEDRGVTDTSFMYERDEDGNLTGYFIQKIWWSKYKNAKNEFFKKLKEKYGDEPEGFEKIARDNEINEWYKNNTYKDKFGNRRPLIEKYANPAWNKLTEAQKEYHSYMMELKSKLDGVLPNSSSVSVGKAPQIRRDFLQRFTGSSLSSQGKYFWENMKDSLVRREDDVEYLDKSVVMDFEGNQVMRLPVYYTKDLQDMNDLSLDTTSSMIAYMAMVNDFNRMNEVIDTLEVGRLVLAERKVNQTEGNKTKTEHFNVLGRQIHNVLTKKGDSTYFMQKLNTFMEMQVYGITHKDEGSLGKVDVAKGADFLNRMTALGTTALSVLTGTANLLQNLTIDRIEATSGRFFNHSELVKAEAIYAKELPAFLGEFGNRIKTNKLALFSELFNVPQNYKSHVRDIQWNRKTWASRLFNSNALWFTTSAGDHFVQHRAAIALALRYKLKDKNGNPVDLWDALEVVPINKDKPKLGAKLQIKQGITKMDGSEFTRADIIKFSNQNRAIQNMDYGIYNDEDKNALQQRAAGRLIMFYRNWMRPLYLNRFGRGKYNYDLQDYTEGYYMTMGRFIYQSMKDLKQSEFDIIRQWKHLSDIEKGNIKKGLTELGFYWSLYAIIAALGAAGGDDGKHKPWFARMSSYALLRLRTDMGVLLPSPSMIDEGLKFFKSPFASISYINKLRKILNLLDPSVYTTTVNSGIYKGYTEAEKIGLDLLPFRKQIVNSLNPDEPARWYK